MGNEKELKVFKKFLKKNGSSYLEFVIETRSFGNQEEVFLERSPANWFIAAFDWHTSERGFHYWHKMNEGWEKLNSGVLLLKPSTPIPLLFKDNSVVTLPLKKNFETVLGTCRSDINERYTEGLERKLLGNESFDLVRKLRNRITTLEREKKELKDQWEESKRVNKILFQGISEGRRK